MNKKAVATGFFLLSFLFPLRASAASFSNLYVFGDSLSDQGNVFNATGGAIPPSPPYFDGRFSNGLVWVDYLVQDLGLEVNPFVGNIDPTEGINFAFGGATTGVENTISLTFPQVPGLPGLQQQISFFTNTVPAADPNALYIVWAGANDYSPTDGTFIPFQDPDTTIANLSQAVTSLANVGAKNIMVVNLPDLGRLPISLNTPDSERLTTLTESHNAALEDLSQSFDSSINLILFDVNESVEQVFATPQEFGFTNVTTPCLFVQSCVINPDVQNQYLFWDERHPTTAAHQLVGDFALAALNADDPTGVPEPASAIGLLAIGALGAGSALKRKKREQSHQVAVKTKAK
ncbi:SGNH/GDSL hydrolase family protein [Microcoleus sp. FACHB-SPT15]|uniref:SGNH/GDSL hydrolase family protein n=1 Tax=Microcoleus sp. FACHB-SPT15 TaxID=2692830 RepID=UPI00178089E2|nr:SGNH/GDSL hydrolase family protein [Microcoleus sp. FACHB-SPT15]MBD1807889.1 SGNH/GDSL hydrolase family protein [Microcoleus sp. FACHB-SPT15]